MNRRRYRRKRRGLKHNEIKSRVLPVMLLICTSVVAGYLTATYLIGPALNLDTQVTFFDYITEKTNNMNNEKNKKEVPDQTDNKQIVQDELDNETGFALQFGSFSTKQGAQECSSELSDSGIDSEIIEKNGTYKVVSRTFDTKEEAREYKKQFKDMTDVFITEIP